MPTAREGLLLDEQGTRITGMLLGQMVTSSMGKGDGRTEELTTGIGAS